MQSKIGSIQSKNRQIQKIGSEQVFPLHSRFYTSIAREVQGISFGKYIPFYLPMESKVSRVLFKVVISLAAAL